jgi:hypothetical protein
MAKAKHFLSNGKNVFNGGLPKRAAGQDGRESVFFKI